MTLFRRPISTLLSIAVIVFLITLGYFYIETGSFEDAGAKMDVALNDAGKEAEQAATTVADGASDVAQDIADGRDRAETE